MTDAEYEDIVRALPCLVYVRGRDPSPCKGRVQFCHRKHSGMGGKAVPSIGNGWPGCMGHHAESHHMGKDSFAERYGFDMLVVVGEIESDIRDGSIFVEE